MSTTIKCKGCKICSGKEIVKVDGKTVDALIIEVKVLAAHFALNKLFQILIG